MKKDNRTVKKVKLVKNAILKDKNSFKKGGFTPEQL